MRNSTQPIIVFIITLGIFYQIPLFAHSALKTKIIDVWPSGTAVESDALHDTYTFYPNGKFIFTFNRYLGANRVKSLSGKYRIDKDSLFIKVITRKEIVGGIISNSYNPGASLGWIISGGKEKIIKQLDKDWTSCFLEVCKSEIVEDYDSKRAVKCLWIFDTQYYKIRDSPFSKDID